MDRKNVHFGTFSYELTTEISFPGSHLRLVRDHETADASFHYYVYIYIPIYSYYFVFAPEGSTGVRVGKLFLPTRKVTNLATFFHYSEKLLLTHFWLYATPAC